jgi:hypothetical protein
MFAKLCIYAFFLAAITTITIGSPLEVSSMHKRHFARCNETETTLLSSSCFKMNAMDVSCMPPNNGTIYHVTVPCEQNQICVDYEDKHGSAQAFCVESSNVKTWSNAGNNKLSCSDDKGYALKSGTDLYTGVTTYNEYGDIVKVHKLQTFKSDKEVEYNFSQNNITKTIPKYNNEHIKYCFVPNTSENVTAVAAGVYYGDNQRTIPPVSVAPLKPLK